VTATRISCKYVRNLSAQEYQQCRHLCYQGGVGVMRRILASEYERQDVHDPRRGWNQWEPARVLMLHEVQTQRLLGWCLLRSGYKNVISLYLYVRASSHRQGVGRRLMRRALALHPRARVSPCDDGARAFFTSISYLV
jgi:GNAT superfamily N-acetyltransferase